MMFTFLLLAYYFVLVLSQSPTSPSSCEGTRNTIPFYVSPPSFVTRVNNGQLYTTGDPKTNTSMSIVHLWGSDYEMGYAYGQLLSSQLKTFLISTMDSFLEEYIEKMLPFLSPEVAAFIEKYGFYPFLDLLWINMKDATPPYFLELMQGVADGSGVTYTRVLHFNILPTILFFGCTIIGVEKEGEAPNGGGMHSQIRALDFDESMPIFQFPVIAVYHYEDGTHPVTTFGGLAWMGYLSGFSKFEDAEGNFQGRGDEEANRYFSMSQKMWIAGMPETHLPEGVPWTFNFYDVLRHTSGLDDAVKRFEEAARLVTTYVGIGDSKEGFRLVDYNVPPYGEFKVYTWETQTEYAEHPRIPYVTYLDKGKQPSPRFCLADLLKGTTAAQLTGEEIAREIAPVSQTGNLQVVVWDFDVGKVYVSHTGANEGVLACDKQYVVLDIEADLFGVSNI